MTMLTIPQMIEANNRDVRRRRRAQRLRALWAVTLAAIFGAALAWALVSAGQAAIAAQLRMPEITGAG